MGLEVAPEQKPTLLDLMAPQQTEQNLQAFMGDLWEAQLCNDYKTRHNETKSLDKHLNALGVTMKVKVFMTLARLHPTTSL